MAQAEMELIKQLTEHLDSRFDNVEKTLEKYIETTTENTRSITILQEKQIACSSGMAEWKAKESDQHKEFYDKLNFLSIENTKTRTQLVMLGGALTLIMALLKFIL